MEHSARGGMEHSARYSHALAKLRAQRLAGADAVQLRACAADVSQAKREFNAAKREEAAARKGTAAHHGRELAAPGALRRAHAALHETRRLTPFSLAVHECAVGSAMQYGDAVLVLPSSKGHGVSPRPQAPLARPAARATFRPTPLPLDRAARCWYNDMISLLVLRGASARSARLMGARRARRDELKRPQWDRKQQTFGNNESASRGRFQLRSVVSVLLPHGLLSEK